MIAVFRLLGLLLVTALSSGLVSAKSSNLIDDALAPFSGIDFSRTYDTNSAIIDLIIYTILLKPGVEEGQGRADFFRYIFRRKIKSMSKIISEIFLCIKRKGLTLLWGRLFINQA